LSHCRNDLLVSLTAVISSSLANDFILIGHVQPHVSDFPRKPPAKYKTPIECFSKAMNVSVKSHDQKRKYGQLEMESSLRGDRGMLKITEGTAAYRFHKLAMSNYEVSGNFYTAAAEEWWSRL
jgi:hypothetical protein